MPTDVNHQSLSISADVEEEEDNAAALIAGALNQLSINEREKVYHEMHGVDDVVEETPEMLQRNIIALDTELENRKNAGRSGLAYNMAEAMSRNYVLDPGLRIKFLRSEKFDVKKSAERMISFFDIKLQLFGHERLCKDITLDDLDKNAMHSLKAGHAQLLPTRDRSGRVVCFAFHTPESTATQVENIVRKMFYLLMSATEDEETQKRGMTRVIFFRNEKLVKTFFDPVALKLGARLATSLPIKIYSHHVCFDKAEYRAINIAANLLNRDGRARMKLHCGTQMELLYKLMTFGIPIDSVPLSAEGELKRKNHMDFLKMRQRQELMMLGIPRIVIPTHRDVLFGRGKPFREHRGNVNLYEMIDSKLEHYKSRTAKEKTKTILEMVHAVMASGGRFLKQEYMCWMMVDEKMAKEKVSHSFRSRLRVASSRKGERKMSESEVVSGGVKRFKKALSEQDM